MFYGILMTFLCILAVYGAVRLLLSIYGHFACREEISGIKRHTVLFFKDNEDEAECTVRAIIFERGAFGGEIIAVDKGSTDDTVPILRGLEREYEFLHIMSMEEYTDFVTKV